MHGAQRSCGFNLGRLLPTLTNAHDGSIQYPSSALAGSVHGGGQAEYHAVSNGKHIRYNEEYAV